MVMRPPAKISTLGDAALWDHHKVAPDELTIVTVVAGYVQLVVT